MNNTRDRAATVEEYTALQERAHHMGIPDALIAPWESYRVELEPVAPRPPRVRDSERKRDNRRKRAARIRRHGR